MKTAQYVTFVLLFLLATVSCKKDIRQNVLSVRLEPKEVLASELFKKIEIIPLETIEESLITSIGRIREYNDRYYILDDRISALFCFNKKGDYLYKISKTGNGPDEYYLIYETIIDSDKNRILMLSPMGIIHIYDMDGNFLEKKVLTEDGQQDMIEIEKNIIAYWILGNSDNKISFYDIEKEKTIGGFWKDTDDNFMTNLCIDVFYQYKNENYFSTQFANEVYKFKKDTFELAYIWDFGVDNINLKPYKEQVKNDMNLFSKLTETMEIPYFFFRQFQNRDYYYTTLETWTIDRWRNVFYRKSDGKSFVFDALKGGAKIKNTNIFTDDYMISVLNPENIHSYREILPTDEYAKVKNLKEDDNLCLVKLYFK